MAHSQMGEGGEGGGGEGAENAKWMQASCPTPSSRDPLTTHLESASDDRYFKL